MAKKDQNGQNNRKLYIIIALLSGLVLVLGGLLLQQKGQNNDLNASNENLAVERNDLQEELGLMLEQYDALSVENEEITAEMLAQKEEITLLMEKVNKLNKDDKNLRWEIDKLKKEAKTLRGIMKSYLVKIDSLNMANAELTEENTTLSSNLSQVTSQKQQLESTVENQENLIKEGKVITAVNMTSTGLRVKATGKQVETNRASRAEMIRTCCTLGENRITKAGKKTLHVRIISPEGIVLDNPDNVNAVFDFEGITGKYSTKRDIEYKNEPQEVCVFYSVGNDLKTGQYIVELYESGAMIGKTTFDLR